MGSCVHSIRLIAMEVNSEDYRRGVRSLTGGLSHQQAAVGEAKIFLLSGHRSRLEQRRVQRKFSCESANLCVFGQRIEAYPRETGFPALLYYHCSTHCDHTMEARYKQNIELLATCLALVCPPFVCLYIKCAKLLWKK